MYFFCSVFPISILPFNYVDSTCADCSLADLPEINHLPLKLLNVLITTRFECIMWQVIFQFMYVDIVVQFKKQE